MGFHWPMKERRRGKVCVSVASPPPLSFILGRRTGAESESHQPTGSLEGPPLLGGPSHHVTEWQEAALFLLLLFLYLLPHLIFQFTFVFLFLPILSTYSSSSSSSFSSFSSTSST